VSLAEIAATAIELFPQLLRIPLIGRLLSAFRQNPYNEHQAIEALQGASDRNRETRTRLKRENNKHVIKVSDAMQCVEDQLADGRLAWTLFRSLGRTLIGLEGADAAEATMTAIFDCFVRKKLTQSRPRTSTRTTTHGRPARGHGKGRRSFGA
jgi:hypothetical protein